MNMKQINKIMFIVGNKAKLILDFFRKKQYLELFYNDILIIDFCSTIENRFYIYYHTSFSHYETLVCSFDKKLSIKEYNSILHSIRNLINETNK